MHIFMDDTRTPDPGFILTRTVDEALALTRKNQVETLSLDYNMGIHEKNGFDFAYTFCQEGLFAKTIIIHSNDIIGAKRMMDTFIQAQAKGLISSNIFIERKSSYWV